MPATGAGNALTVVLLGTAGVQTIRNHHTDGAEGGRIFERVKPKLAVFSHDKVDPVATLRLVRQTYAGPVEFGEDLMTIDIGDTIAGRRFTVPGK